MLSPATKKYSGFFMQLILYTTGEQNQNIITFRTFLRNL